MLRDEQQLLDCQPFQRHELTILFQQPRFTRPNIRQPHQFWSPLLALYAGLRTSELVQLTVQDITTNQGVPLLKIRNSAAQLREIPLNIDLYNIGLLDYAEELKAKGIKSLFPDLYGKDTAVDNISRAFKLQLTRAHISTSRRKGLTSLRACLLEDMRSSGTSIAVISEIMGLDTNLDDYEHRSEEVVIEKKLELLNKRSCSDCTAHLHWTE